MNVRTNKVFASAYRSELSQEQNQERHAKALEVLRREGSTFRVMRGVWLGAVEDSLMLEATDVREHERNLEVAIDLGRLFGQDAVLEVHNDGAAVLHSLGRGYSTERVGTFREADKAVAVLRDGYTCDPITGRYYVID